MNPVFFNCLLLFLMVIVLSLVQSRLQVFKESPLFFLFIVFIMPFVILGKASKGGRSMTWMELTAVEIFIFTLMIAFYAAKNLVPK